MGEIQRKAAKQSKRNAVSRLVHAKNDKEAIAGWKSDLNRILHVFNVRSATFVRQLLTLSSQTELAINTNVVVSDIRHDVVNTHTIVSDIHRTIVGSQDGTDEKNRSVGVTYIVLVAESTLTIP